MAMPNFDHIHQKIIEITFSFPEFAPACKKLVHSINSFLRYSLTRLATLISDHAHSQIFWLTFNLCEFVSTYEKSGYFIDLFWRYGWLKNPAIWLAENILAHISGTKSSQIWDLCRNTEVNINFHYRSNSVKN